MFQQLFHFFIFTVTDIQNSITVKCHSIHVPQEYNKHPLVNYKKSKHFSFSNPFAIVMFCSMFITLW